MKFLKLSLLCIILLVSSCAEVSKEVAKEQLLGTYEGKRTLVLQYSQVNPDVADETTEEDARIFIEEDNSTGVVYVQENSKITLSNITFASNGTLFSIRQQKAVESTGDFLIIKGVESFELEGNGYDGMLNTDNNTLTFQYSTILEFEYEGVPVKVPSVVIYEFKKKQ